MNIDVKKVKIIVTAPEEDADKIKEAICNEGAGVIGNYTHCTMSTKCIGTFRPSKDANPYIGEKNKLEIVNEEKIEAICDIDIAKKVILKLREVHPYEEPAIELMPLIDENDL